jgi:hypothetical protein
MMHQVAKYRIIAKYPVIFISGFGSPLRLYNWNSFAISKVIIPKQYVLGLFVFKSW